MKSIKEIIGKLRVAMTDARQNESHFESWMILNEAICNAIDALAEQPIQQGITLDGMTANEFALAELYAFQEATGCDTADQLKAQPKREQKLEFVLPGGGYVPAIPRPLPLDWKLVPRKATPEMLRAMDECAQEGYDERLYEGMASSVYMAAWDASPVMGTLPEQPAQQQACDSKTGESEMQSDLRFAGETQAQQEPVAWITQGGKGWLRWHNKNDDHLNKTSVPLYKHPKRKPLSDAEIALISAECSLRTPSDIYFARAIEAAHGIKENRND